MTKFKGPEETKGKPILTEPPESVRIMFHQAAKILTKKLPDREAE